MLEMYTEQELDMLEKHIQEYFGKYENVFHEIISSDIHVDVCLIEPTEERPFWTLVTMGMGAHRMNVPEELAEYKLDRAELVISLPKEWKIKNSEEKWYWPLRWLKILARLPLEEDTWLGWGHTVSTPDGEPFAENTQYTGLLLLSPIGFDEEAAVCGMPDGSEVNFYCMVPIYTEEMEYKFEYDAESLISLWEEDDDEIRFIPLDLHRKNVCEGRSAQSPALFRAEESAGALEEGGEAGNLSHFEEAGDCDFQAENISAQRPLLSDEDVAVLESFQGDTDGYFGKMLMWLMDFIDNGVAEERFTQEEACEDLDIALWYSYACNNLDDYEHYYMAAQWMPASEKNAAGCGTWYYRYSCALMYCGRLEEALMYAEKGAQEEPEYPWIWLQVAKLRSHFGDEAGAQEAAQIGLVLVPEDYEFMTLLLEIENGCTLAEMEYHYIDPDNDRQLQDGQIADSYEKVQAIAGIICDRQKLEQIKEIFHPVSWEADSPYCVGRFFAEGKERDIYELDAVFRMNEAALSKMDADWLRHQKETFTEDVYLLRHAGEASYQLQAIVFGRDYSTDMVYQNCRNDNSFRICVHKNGGKPKKPDPALIDMALEEAERNLEGENSDFQMFKLYRKENGTLKYAECWTDEGRVVEHTGNVGEEGSSEDHPCASKEEQSRFFQSLRDWYLSQEYSEWPDEEKTSITVQFPKEAVYFGSDGSVYSEEAFREHAQVLLNEALGWNGLGHVDGWDVGRKFDMSDSFVLNIYCLTVDRDRSVPVICRALEVDFDCSRMKIASKAPNEEDYALIYSADGSEDFSL